MSLSVIIPAYNEKQRLPGTLAQVTRHLSASGRSYEIIVVDDGSTDATIDVVTCAASRDSRVRLIAASHAGKGNAVRTGMLAARGERVLFCDADLPVDAEELTRLADRLQHSDVVIATREGVGARRIGEPGYRHLMGRVFNLLVRSIVVPGIHDTQCGVKCFRARAARSIFSLQSIAGFGFDVEVLFLARRFGYRICQVPVEWHHQPSSRVDPIRDTVRMFGDVLRIRAKQLRGAYRHPTGVSTTLAQVGGER